MDQQQYFSPGLLYSIAPGNFTELHLNDESQVDAFDWRAHESEFAGDTFAHAVFNLLRTTAAKWGVRHH